METYLRRLAAQGAAAKGIASYRYQLRSVLRIAGRLAGRPIGLADLFLDSDMLGRALVDDVAAGRNDRLSKWTLAQRRSALRSFATLMRPELVARDDDPHLVLDRALRGVAERVGGGYRLTGGRERRRGGRTPTSAEIDATIIEAGSAPGFVGLRNRAFFGILAASGSRVNALLQLDGPDCFLLPSGRLRLFLREKGKLRQREVELSAKHAENLLTYVEEYNLHASRRGWRGRIRLGEHGPVWRNSDRGRWPYDDVRSTLRTACAAANVPPFTPHALRRAFATDAASVLPRHVVALAGGWQGVERLDDHYVRPRQPRIWEKFRHVEPQDQDSGVAKDAVGEAVTAV